MRVLWITNAPFPEVSEHLKLNYSIKGWVFSSAHELIKHYPVVILGVASIYKGKQFKKIEIGSVQHFLIPQKARNNATSSENDIFWSQIKELFNPDVVHIHGSEYPYSYSYIRACGNQKVVVSIQGLISVIERYYLGGIAKSTFLKSITIRDIFKLDNIFLQHLDLMRRAKYEISLFRSVNHVIGRTSWDKIHVTKINPEIKYHFCNETLRESFYLKKWSIQKCRRYSIFINQAYYPIKGLHILIKALPLILKFYPDTIVYVSGNNFFTNRGWLINGYGRYINSLMNKLDVENRFIFTGVLSEEEICRKYLESHVFVCPSAIENSSNSIGEAQLLGVPCIASYVGGTPDIIKHEETGLLYRFEEFEMLAANICKIFSEDKLAMKLSENARNSAELRHNRKVNASELYKIYSKILSI